MNKITGASNKELKFSRLIIFNEFISAPKRSTIKETLIGSKKREILIKPPKICPICGSKEIAGELMINEKIRGISRDNPTYLEVLVCKEHQKLKKINLKMIFLILFSIFICFFIMIIISPFDSIIFIVGFCTTLAYLIFNLIKYQEDIKLIEKFIIFEYFSERSVISIRNYHWAEEFKQLNSCDEFKGDLRLFEKLEAKYKRIKVILGIMLIIAFLGIIPSLIIYNFILIYTVIVIVSGLAVALGSVEIYSLHKLPKVKAEIYFNNY